MTHQPPPESATGNLLVIVTALILIGGTLGGILLAPDRRAADLALTRSATDWPPKPFVATEESPSAPVPDPITP